jgi:hypothetical protein
MVESSQLLGGFLGHLAQTPNGRPHCHGRSRTERIRATSHDLSAGSAFPNAHTGSLDRVLTTKDASVGAVLGDFDFAQQFTERTTVSRTVLSGNSNLLCSFSHFCLCSV